MVHGIAQAGVVSRVYRTARRAVALFAALAAGFASASDGVSFAHRPLLAGKASLVSDGFEMTRTLGVAAFAPELQLPSSSSTTLRPRRPDSSVTAGGRRSSRVPSAGTGMVSFGRRRGARK